MLLRFCPCSIPHFHRSARNLLQIISSEASRELVPGNADGLIVRKVPEFVKNNCLSVGVFQRLVKV
jgi:hypothetical protein